MDFHAADRDEVVAKIARDLSDSLSFEGIRHYVYFPNELNDGVSMISDSEQPFEVAKFEHLVPRKWDVTISHQDEDSSAPFAILRVFRCGDFAAIRRINIKNLMEAAKTIGKHIK